MRDGLSLLDQAIAFGGGQVEEAGVRTMLGTLPGDLTLDLLEALGAGDGARVLGEVERVASLTPDFEELLREVIAVLHRVALVQQVPEILAPDDPDAPRIRALAAQVSPEDVQLYYQVALTGQQDLPLAPDPRAGFEMVLLRALAFRPVSARDRAGKAQTQQPLREPTDASRVRPVVQPAGGSMAGSGFEEDESSRGQAGSAVSEPSVSVVSGAPAEPSTQPTGPVALSSHADWLRLVDRLKLGGIASQIAHHCDLEDWSNGRLVLSLDPTAEHLRSAGAEARLTAALEAALGSPVRLELKVRRSERETLAQRRARETEERRVAAVATMEADPHARRIIEDFDATWIPDSIRPAD
jgi:DNA polymerase-3 subunit gamma/tau